MKIMPRSRRVEGKIIQLCGCIGVVTLVCCSLCIKYAAIPEATVYLQDAKSDNISDLPSRLQNRLNVPRASRSARGYVAGWEFTEEQTCALRNLLGLQHWATTINYSVVEPFVYNSFFAMCYFLSNPTVHSLRFRDYFDINDWNNHVMRHNVGKPLVSWEQFVQNASRELIVVNVLTDCKGGTKVFVDEEVDDECKIIHGINYSHNFTDTSLSNLGFKIVRWVCFKFTPLSTISIADFNNYIVGPFNSSNPSVLFISFPGVFPGRINFKETGFHHRHANWLKCSECVREDSKKYIGMFLGNDNFTAVAIRTVKIATDLNTVLIKPIAVKVKKFFEQCIDVLTEVLVKVSGRIFLALDIGRFGALDESKYLTPEVSKYLIDNLIRIVYNNTWNQAIYERSFITATGGVSDKGYIASLQREVILQATYIIIGGKGNFQRSLKENFKYKSSITIICNYTNGGKLI